MNGAELSFLINDRHVIHHSSHVIGSPLEYCVTWSGPPGLRINFVKIQSIRTKQWARRIFWMNFTFWIKKRDELDIEFEPINPFYYWPNLDGLQLLDQHAYLATQITWTFISTHLTTWQVITPATASWVASSIVTDRPWWAAVCIQ